MLLFCRPVGSLLLFQPFKGLKPWKGKLLLLSKLENFRKNCYYFQYGWS